MMDSINSLFGFPPQEENLPLWPEEPYLLCEEDVVDADSVVLTAEEVEEGRGWLSTISLEQQMTKNAILYGWKTGLIQSPKEAIHQLIEAGVFPWETVMDMLVIHARTGEIIEGS